jgi:hypothetical protein
MSFSKSPVECRSGKVIRGEFLRKLGITQNAVLDSLVTPAHSCAGKDIGVVFEHKFAACAVSGTASFHEPLSSVSGEPLEDYEHEHDEGDEYENAPPGLQSISPPSSPRSSPSELYSSMSSTSSMRSDSCDSMASLSKSSPPTLSSLRGSLAHEKGVRRGSGLGNRRRLRFKKSVKVLYIPSRGEYSDSTKDTLWPTAYSLHRAAVRNSIEYVTEGYNWRQCLEEDSFIHVEGLGHGMGQGEHQGVHATHATHATHAMNIPHPIHPAHFMGDPAFVKGMNEGRREITKEYWERFRGALDL